MATEIFTQNRKKLGWDSLEQKNKAIFLAC